MSVRILPTIDGFTIDERLREFRWCVPGEQLEFIPFDGDEGQRLIRRVLLLARRLELELK